MNKSAISSLRFTVALAAVFVLGLKGNSNAQEAAKQAETAGKSNVTANAASSATDQERAELNDKLAKYLTQTRWEGRFTMTGKDGDTSPEYYEIISAEKGEIGDYWNLVARIKYGGKDATLPLPPIEIKFAGGTPVITVDQAVFPGFGTFDARVVIRQGKYAGTWSHGDVGGHLFGTIKKIESDKSNSKEDGAKDGSSNSDR